MALISLLRRIRRSCKCSLLLSIAPEIDYFVTRCTPPPDSPVNTTVAEVENSKIGPLKKSLQRQGLVNFVKTLEIFFAEVNATRLEGINSDGPGHIAHLQAELEKMAAIVDPLDDTDL